MKHICITEARKDGIWPILSLESACGVTIADNEPFTFIALQSDCDKCRAKLLVGPLNQKGCGLREPLSYTPEPMTGIESAEEIQRKRDGR